MPSGRKQKAITLSFGKKNEDVFNLLQEKKIDKYFIQNDYVCECVRFFEKYKDSVNGSVNEEKVKDIVKKQIEELKKELFNKNVMIEENQVEKSLEEKIKDIDDDDLEED